MSTLRKLNAMLSAHTDRCHTTPTPEILADIDAYAAATAHIEGAIVVVSDLQRHTSTIHAGALAHTLGIADYTHENSIWEQAILEMLTPYEREQKYLAELRFLHHITQLPPKARHHCHLTARLRMHHHGTHTDILHRMYYISRNTRLRLAICIYQALPFDIPAKSYAVDSRTGTACELTGAADHNLLTNREKQILSLIAAGHTTAAIAATLSISPHTVSRHRQSILSRLNVRNSAEACHIARTLHLI
ncbi:MAG: helix-turn-helix transcriptional regulator [Muribaculaceae bacterium]|nr:helix-turn-helix transcriptional regulator [Muribaculaceae bacterium]